MTDSPTEHTEGLLRIGEVARLFNLSVGTLRHYEPPSTPSVTCVFSTCR